MDVAIYETFVRMSQPWINNIPEVDWHGNNGNVVIGNEPASARYTEARLSKAIEEGMFQGLKKNNVPMQLNFSEDEEWPEVLPAIFPRLLINGCQGIGVTIANVWVPMNLMEVTEGIRQYIESGTLDTNKYYFDFPTGGTIINKDDLHVAHETGKGKVILRAKTEIVDNVIRITEFPYQVFIEDWIEDVKTLITKNEIDGIDEIYNKTDKNNLLVEVVCSSAPLKVLNDLFRLTDLQKSFSPNQWALVGKTPKLLTLKEYFDIYINHNLECIKRENSFDLEKSQARIEIVEGLLKAILSIDDIIALIKKSDSSKHAVENLIKTYDFTTNQAKAIVAMRLGTLAKLEGVELNQEKAELTSQIQYCLEVLNNEDKQKDLFLSRLTAFTKKYGKPRRTELTQIEIKKAEKEKPVIEPEDCVVVMTEGGNIKRIPSSMFSVNNRATRGIKTQDDITSSVIRTNTVDNLMIFSSSGLMYRICVNDIPVGTNISKGVSVKSLVSMEPNESPAIIYSVYKDTKAKFVFFVTKNGLVKKTPLSDYEALKKKGGTIAIKLKEGDSLARVTLVDSEDILLITKNGMAVKFNTNEVGATGRITTGVKGINLKSGDEVIAALPIHDPTDDVGIFIDTGCGKRVPNNEFLLQKRGGVGVLAHKGEGKIVAAQLINDNDYILVVGDKSSVCLSCKEVPVLSRTGIGNIMIKGGRIKTVSKVNKV